MKAQRDFHRVANLLVHRLKDSSGVALSVIGFGFDSQFHLSALALIELYLMHVAESVRILEAMKMEQTIKARMDGFIETILVRMGDVVAPGEPLVQVSAE